MSLPETFSRRNRLEHILKQQEYYGNTEVLFGPETKALYSEEWQAHGETMQVLQNQTLAALADAPQRVWGTKEEAAFLMSELPPYHPQRFHL